MVEENRTVEKYALQAVPENSVAGNLKFALKNEPLDMGVISGVMAKVDAKEIEAMVRNEPTGAFSRRAWFLYEWFTGRTLDLPDAQVIAYTSALDTSRNVGSEGRYSQRHRVIDNMLGVPGFCFTVRRTDKIAEFQASDISGQTSALVHDCEPEVLSRAVNYLYTKETKSSFEIEHEKVTGRKAERFVAALKHTKDFDPTSRSSLVQLQNTIVDPRYAAKDYRDFQNFVGETLDDYREKVHFICPKPEDLGGLMADWSAMTDRLRNCQDPVVGAAVIAFSFVFLHPFEDGNGRIHRFLIHHVLSREGFTPEGILFPVSAAIMRDQRGYDAALESYSAPWLQLTDWVMNQDRVVVKSETSHLYRYFDATRLATFLYTKIDETLRIDFRNELQFVTQFDTAYRTLRAMIDMPDKRARTFVVYLLTNNGKLSKSKRGQYSELSDDEIRELEVAITEALEELSEPKPEVPTGLPRPLM